MFTGKCSEHEQLHCFFDLNKEVIEHFVLKNRFSLRGYFFNFDSLLILNTTTMCILFPSKLRQPSLSNVGTTLLFIILLLLVYPFVKRPAAV